MLLLESLHLCPPTSKEGYFHGITSYQREGKEKLLSISSESLTLPTSNRRGEDEYCLIVVIPSGMHMRKHIFEIVYLAPLPTSIEHRFYEKQRAWRKKVKDTSKFFSLIQKGVWCPWWCPQTKCGIQSRSCLYSCLTVTFGYFSLAENNLSLMRTDKVELHDQISEYSHCAAVQSSVTLVQQEQYAIPQVKITFTKSPPYWALVISQTSFCHTSRTTILTIHPSWGPCDSR